MHKEWGTKLFAVIGRPVAHSLSPSIHNNWFESAKIDARYIRLHSLDENHALQFAKNLHVQGLNVTSPYKEKFIDFCTVDAHAKNIGAVNTVDLSSEDIVGTNTDWQGVANPLRAHLKETDYSKLHAVVLGSGGAAKAAVYALVSKLKVKTTVLARNAQLKETFQNLGADFHLLSSNNSSILFRQADIVISTIPADAAIPDGYAFNPSGIFFDAIYKNESNFFALAKKSGIKTIHGIEWLWEQAKPAFSLFTKNAVHSSPEKLPLLLNPTTSKKPIILIGMMGTGKSSVSKALSHLNLKTVDLDEWIEKEENLSISDIFQNHGESYFRQREKDALSKIITQGFDVISCGGGIVTTPEARETLQNHSTIWLWASIDTLTTRLLDESQKRPLLSPGQQSLNFEELRDKLQALETSRKGFYASSCMLVMDAQSMSAKQIAQEIVNETGIKTDR